MSVDLGTRLGRYEIRSLIGRGGMGIVYCAHDAALNRDVAVKVMPADVSQDADRLGRFKQEAQALARLNHPNILSILDVGSDEGSFYVVSELLEGQTLHERSELEGVSVRKALDYAVQILRGLAAAHEKGIVHRDLKPENIFITKDGHVKILDRIVKRCLEKRPDDRFQSASDVGYAIEALSGMTSTSTRIIEPKRVRRRKL